MWACRWSVMKEAEDLVDKQVDYWPCKELDFWAARALELQGILMQLQGPVATKVMEALRLSQSSYCEPLKRAIHQVTEAANEARSNTCHLETIRHHVQVLQDFNIPFAHSAGSDVERQEELQALDGSRVSSGLGREMQPCESWQQRLHPVMHILYLISKTSPYYRTSNRVGFFVRLLENLTIQRAREYVYDGRGNSVFLDRSNVAVARLQGAMLACSALKDLYLKYEALSQQDCVEAGQEAQDSPWTSTGMFARLYLFIQRCQDVLYFTKSASTFDVLQTVHICGTNGYKSTARARSLHEDIHAAIQLLTHVDYSLLLVEDATPFEDDFSRLCNRLKALQVGGLSFLQLAYEDCHNLECVSDLILSLKDVLLLPTFCALLAKMLTRAVQLYCAQVEHSRTALIAQQSSQTARFGDNFAAVSSKLYGAKALLNRLGVMDARLRSLAPLLHTLQVQGYMEAFADTERLRCAILQVERVTYGAWVKKVEEVPDDVLHEPILIVRQRQRLDAEDRANAQSADCVEQRVHVQVNLDESVLEHLREAKYLRDLGYHLPNTAMYLFERSEKIRGHLAHLKLIVNQYNYLFGLCAQPEWPLVVQTLDGVRQMVLHAASSITWNSNRIHDFIVNMSCQLQTGINTMEALMRQRAAVMLILEQWGRHPLFRRKKTQSYSLSAFDHLHSIHVTACYQMLQEGTHSIHQLIDKSMALCGCNWTVAHWICYVEHLQGLCAQCLKKFVEDNLSQLLLELHCHAGALTQTISGEAHDEMSADLPLLEISIELLHGSVMQYVPPVLSTRTGTQSIQASVHEWKHSIVDAVSHATCDAHTVDYMAGITNDGKVRDLQEAVRQSLHKTVQLCSDYKDSFKDYDFLWLQAGEEHFQHIVATVIMVKGAGTPDMQAVARNVDELLHLGQRLATYLDLKRMDWVRVDARPLKSAISMLLSARLNRHIVFLQDYLATNLDKVNRELVCTTQELSQANDLRTGHEFMLPLVLRAVVSIKERRDKLEHDMNSLENVASFLRGHGYVIEAPREQHLITIFQLWTDVQKFALQVKDKYSSLIAAEQERLRKRVNTLLTHCQDARGRYADSFLWLPAETSQASYRLISENHAEICLLLRDETEVLELQRLLDLPHTSHTMPIINECFLQIYAAKKLWDVNDLIQTQINQMSSLKWSEVQVAELLTGAQDLMLELKRLTHSNDPKTQTLLEHYVGGSKAYRKLEQDVIYLLLSLPLAGLLQHPAICQRHLKKLMSISGEAFALDDNVRLSKMLSLGLPVLADHIHTLVASAEKEVQIEEELKALQDRWSEHKLITVNHSDAEMLVLSSQMQSVVSSLLEIEVQVSQMLQKRFAQVFRESAFVLQKTLAQSVELIQSLMAAQNIWLTLIGIMYYDTTGMIDMVPDLKPTFQQADQALRQVLNDTLTHEWIKDVMPSILDLTSRTSSLLHSLGSCQQVLRTWLNQRRAEYPRLYLVSDQELMNLLSEGMHSPRNLVKFLPRILHGIHSLEFASAVHSTGNEVVAVFNQQNERLQFDQELKFSARHTVMEDWLRELELRVSHALKRGVVDGVRNMATYQLKHSAVLQCVQVVVLSFKVQWTGLVERALSSAGPVDAATALQDLHKCSQQNVHKLAVYLRDMTLDSLKRSKYAILLASELWGKDAIAYLATALIKTSSPLKKTSSPDLVDSTHMFEWQLQMRFYLRHAQSDEESACRLRIGDSSLDYAFEFMDLKEPFCFSVASTRSLMGFCMVMQNRMIVALGASRPGAPSCVGKTETFKQMATAAGQQMHVFNASPHLVRNVVAGSLLGLSQSGAWGLFENFDKVPVDLMCYIACLIKSLMNALRSGGDADVDGIHLTPSPAFAFFISLGSHRTVELQDVPHDLAVLLRPVAVLPPDLRALAQLLLIARGFVNACELSLKLCLHLQLCSNMIGPIMTGTLKAPLQDIWCNLSTLRTIIHGAGLDKLAYHDTTDEDDDGTQEHVILVHRILRFNAASILPAQLDSLSLITQAVFGTAHLEQAVAQEHVVPPTVTSPPTITGAHAPIPYAWCRVRKTSLSRGVEVGPKMTAKMSDLRSILSIRMSTYLLGAPGVGKTKTWRSLAHMGMEDRKVVVQIMNPNALDVSMFCGCYGRQSSEWRPGAFSNLMRNTQQCSPTADEAVDFKWIVLDGEVEAVWLELLASCFDSLERLALDSGEVLHIGPEVRILMETCSLEHALPCAVARSGVLHIGDTVVSTEDLVSAWLENVERDSVKIEMQLLFSTKLPRLLEFMENSSTLEFFAAASSRSCCLSMLRILDGLITAEGHDWTPASRAEKCLWMFDFAAVWGFGGPLAVDKVIDCRRIFSDWWRQTLGLFGTHELPVTGTIFDYTFNPSTFQMCMWKDLVSSTKYFTPSVRDEIVVSSPLSVCIERLFEVTTHAKHRLLLVGQEGVGKTCMVHEFLKGLPIRYVGRRMALHSHSTADELLMQIKQQLRKKAGQVYGPEGDKTIVFFVDDLSMPHRNCSNLRSTAALLHQLVEHEIFYDLKELRCCEVVNAQYVAAMSPRLGWNGVDARLLNKFCIISVPSPKAHAIASIFSSILASFTSQFDPEVREMAKILGPLMADVHVRLAKYFSTPQYPSHYLFSLHNVTRVLNAVCCANAEVYATPLVYVSLWAYQLHREYCDRLEHFSDVHVFKSILREGMHKHLDAELANDAQVFDTAHIAHFASGTVSPSSVTASQWCDVIKEHWVQYNDSFAPMEMIIWDRVVEHLLRITRVLTRNRACLVLFGQGGCVGRESLVRLASFCCQAQLVTPCLPPLHSPASSSKAHAFDFRVEIESSLMTAGLSGRAICFLLTETLLPHSHLLILINEIFQGDFVYSEEGESRPEHLLFGCETRNKIIDEMREAEQIAQEDAGLVTQVTDKDLWTRFIDLALSNFHVVFCLETQTGLGCLAEFPSIAQKCCISVVASCDDADRIQIVSRKMCTLKCTFDADTRVNNKMEYNVVHVIGSIYTLAQKVGLEFTHTFNHQYALGLSHYMDFINVFLKTIDSSTRYTARRIEQLEKCTLRLEVLKADAEQLIVDRAKWTQQIEEAVAAVQDLVVIIGQKTSELEAIQENIQDSQNKVRSCNENLNRVSSELAGARMSVVPGFKGASSDLK